MKTTLDIEPGEFFDDAVDAIFGEFEEAMENIRKYRSHYTAHAVDVDIHELLERERAIALIWDTGQLLSHYPHLTDDQAWEVLLQCEREHNAERGLTWHDIAGIISEHYPDPDDFLTPEPIARCEKALSLYADSDDASLADLLADLMRWSKRRGHSFVQSLKTVRTHFRHEAAGERRRP